MATFDAAPGWPCGSEFPAPACLDAGSPQRDAFADAADAATEGGTGPAPNPCASSWPQLVDLCSHPAAALTGHGFGPEGNVALEGAQLAYHGGFVVGTDFAWWGTAGGLPFALSVFVSSYESPSETLSPGTYEPANATLYWVGRDGTCEQREVALSLVVDVHEPSGSHEAGSAVRLEGRVQLESEGWQLDFDFAIDRLCHSVSHI